MKRYPSQQTLLERLTPEDADISMLEGTVHEAIPDALDQYGEAIRPHQQGGMYHGAGELVLYPDSEDSRRSVSILPDRYHGEPHSLLAATAFHLVVRAPRKQTPQGTYATVHPLYWSFNSNRWKRSIPGLWGVEYSRSGRSKCSRSLYRHPEEVEEVIDTIRWGTPVRPEDTGLIYRFAGFLGNLGRDRAEQS